MYQIMFLCTVAIWVIAGVVLSDGHLSKALTVQIWALLIVFTFFGLVLSCQSGFWAKVEKDAKESSLSK